MELDGRRRIASLDGLRGMAVLLVVLFHSSLGAENSAWHGVFAKFARVVGWSGVDLSLRALWVPHHGHPDSRPG